MPMSFLGHHHHHPPLGPCEFRCHRAGSQLKTKTSQSRLLSYMTRSHINVPSQKFPVPKITKQTKSHSLKFNVLSSVIDSSGDEV